MHSHNGVAARRYALLGITLDAVTREQLVEAATVAMRSGAENLIFGNHNLHSLHLFHKIPGLREFYARCHVTHIDGMSLVLLGRMLGLSIERQHRTTYLDWIELFLATAESNGWRVYVLGGSAESAGALPELLRQNFPGLRIRSHHGFLQPGDDAAVLDDIHAYGTEVLMVGMSMPRQEQWIVSALPHLRTKLIFNCGAAFEYLVGVKYRPPRWAGQLGVEWLFRMLSEPRRLAGRYLVEPFHVLPLLAGEVKMRMRCFCQEMMIKLFSRQRTAKSVAGRRAP